MATSHGCEMSKIIAMSHPFNERFNFV